MPSLFQAISITPVEGLMLQGINLAKVCPECLGRGYHLSCYIDDKGKEWAFYSGHCEACDTCGTVYFNRGNS